MTIFSEADQALLDRPTATSRTPAANESGGDYSARSRGIDDEPPAA
jgi:hypothetical protein